MYKQESEIIEEIAPRKAMNSWIRKPSRNLSNNISECFKNIEMKSIYVLVTESSVTGVVAALAGKKVYPDVSN